MGLKEIIRRLKIRAAVKRGEKATATGLVSVPTTTGFIQVSPTSPLAVGRPGASSTGSRTNSVNLESERRRQTQLQEIKRLDELKKSEAKRQTERKELERKLESLRISKKEREKVLIIQRSKQLSQEAARRGKGFSRLESERFLGGGGNVSKLRQATREDIQRQMEGKVTINQFLKDFEKEQTSKVSEVVKEGVEKITITPEINILDKIKERIKFKFSKEGLSELNERIKEVDEIAERERRIAREKGVVALIGEGKLPDAVIRSAEIVGEKLLTASDFIKVKLFGGKEMTKEEIEIGGVFLGEIGLFMGIAPITTTTGELIAKLPSNTIVKFTGKQLQKDGKIITDVVFESSGKSFGFAKGITIPKGQSSITITTGKQLKGKLFSAKNKKVIEKSIEKLKSGKGKKFVGIDVALTKDQMVKISSEFEIPVKSLLDFVKKNKQIDNILRLKIGIEQKLSVISKKLLRFERIKKLNAKLRFRKESLIVRKNKIKISLNKVNERIRKQFISSRLIKGLSVVKEEVKFRKQDLIIRKNKLSNELKKVIDQIRQIKVGKVVKEEVKFRLNSLIVRRNKIQKQLSQLNKILFEKKFIKPILKVSKKIKEEVVFMKGSFLLRRIKIKKELSKISKELLKFERIKKLSAKARFRKNALIVRKQKFEDMFTKIGGKIADIKPIKKLRMLIPKKVKLNVIENLKSIGQVSQGKIKLGKSKKNIEDIFSASNIFTKDDLSLIVGKAITKSKDEIKFVGYIKNIANPQKTLGLNPKQKVVFNKALEEVMKVVGSVTKAKQLGLSPKAIQSISSGVVRVAIKPISKPVLLTKVKPSEIIPKLKTKQIQNQIGKLDSKIKQLEKQAQRISQRPKQKTKQKTKQIQKIAEAVKQAQKQKSRLMLKLRPIEKLKLRIRPIIPIKTMIKPPKIPIIPLVIPSGFSKKTLSKTEPVFMVRARRKGKLVNLMARPLIKKDALNYLAFKVDNELLRTAFIVPIGNSKLVVRLPIKFSGYFNKVKSKLRSFRIKEGKKRRLAFGYIEKSKFIGDTKSEIKELQFEKRKAEIKIVKKISKIKKFKRLKKKVILKIRLKKVKVNKKSIKKINLKKQVKKKLLVKKPKKNLKSKKKINKKKKK